MTPAEKLRAAAEKHRERPMSARRPWGREDKIALAVADWLDEIAARHAPSADRLELVLHYYSDEPCEICEDGGHLSTVCSGCYPTWDGMPGHSVYPCAETRRALPLADLILGAES